MVETNDLQFLCPPTGHFGVGYEDYLEGKIKLRLYYPAERKEVGSPYYSASVEKWANDIKAIQSIAGSLVNATDEEKLSLKDKLEPSGLGALTELTNQQIQDLLKITENDIKSLYSIETYTKEGLPIANGKFPAIVFSPGSDNNGSDYVNFITELASHGYCVIAINDRTNKTESALDNLSYTISKIQELHKGSYSKFLSIDIDKMALIGHSLGAYTAVRYVHNDPKTFKAVALLDSPVQPWTKESIMGFEIPSVDFKSSRWGKIYPDPNHPALFELKEENYLIRINNTSHNNFSDWATLQYQPSLKIFNNTVPASKTSIIERDGSKSEISAPNLLDVDPLEGFEKTKLINDCLVQFFDYSIQAKQSNIFTKGVCPTNAKMTIGPTLVKIPGPGAAADDIGSWKTPPANNYNQIRDAKRQQEADSAKNKPILENNTISFNP